MSSDVIAVIYMPFLIVSTVIAILCLGDKRMVTAAKYFIIMCFMVVLWDLCLILFHVLRVPSLVRFFYEAKLSFASFTATFLFLAVLQFYGLNRRLSLPIRLLFYMIPTATAIIALTSPWHDMLRRNTFIDLSGPLHTVSREFGPWLYVHYSYCYLIIIATVILAFYRHFVRREATRLSSSMLIISACVMVAFANAITLLGFVPLPLDPTMMSVNIALVFFFFSFSSGTRITFLRLARDRIFHLMPEHVYIVDTEDRIVELNASAANFLRLIELKTPVHFADILKHLADNGSITRESLGHDADGRSTDLYVKYGKLDSTYNVARTPILDDSGALQGSFIVCQNVTRNRTLINSLSESVNTDPLTGLQNRHAFNLAVDEIDTPENLPISVIFGDLNKLKEVNDQLGHKVGDLYLRHAAHLLSQLVPEGGQLFRIGGDEFIMLIPRFGSAQAAELTERIQSRLSERQNLPFSPSIALGLTIKERPDQLFGDLIDAADQEMYLNKQRAKDQDGKRPAR